MKDPDSLDYDTYPGGMRGFIDHVKATYGYVEPVKKPRMSSPSQRPNLAPKTPTAPAAPSCSDPSPEVLAPAPPAGKKVYTAEENKKYAMINELNFLCTYTSHPAVACDFRAFF